MTTAQTTTRYIPVAKFNQFYPWPTPGSIRNRINAAKRGTDSDFLKCIRKVGGRVLVDEQAFLAWLDEQAETDAEQIRSLTRAELESAICAMADSGLEDNTIAVVTSLNVEKVRQVLASR